MLQRRKANDIRVCSNPRKGVESGELKADISTPERVTSDNGSPLNKLAGIDGPI